MIDQKKILCDICKEQNIFGTYQHQFFKCVTCNKNICPLCRSVHDKSHAIISYEQKNYICKKHNEYYIQYCKKCKINICFMCENDHRDHENIFYSKIMPNYNEILEKNNTLKNSISIFKKNIQEIKSKLGDIADNMQICEEINTNIIDNFETKNRNFEDLQNLNEINDNIMKMTEELNNINNIDNESIKLNNMFDIYHKLMGNTVTKTSSIMEAQESLTKEQLEPILDQLKRYICEIIITFRKRGTGFIIEIPNGDKDMCVLITSSHMIDENAIKNKITIRICTNNGKDEKNIKLNNDRKIYTNEISDITIIELKKDEDFYNFDLDESIIQFLPKKKKKDDKNQEKNESQDTKGSKIEEDNHKYDLLYTRYNNESIYILNYPEKKKASMSCGSLIRIDNEKMEYKCNCDKSSSGAPILLLDDNTVIGIHHGPSKENENNVGTLIIYPIMEFLKMENNLLIIKKDKNYKTELTEEESKEKKKENKNVKLSELDIIYTYKEDEYDDSKEIQLFGSEFVKNNENNCIIILDGKPQKIVENIKLTKALKTKGKLKIKLKEKKKITNMSYLFGGEGWRDDAKFLSDVPNFDKWDMSQVTDVKYMFKGCENLSQLPDISVWNTENITDMTGLFKNCESLTFLPDISKWNTKNVSLMNSMFENCKNLVTLPDISKWDIKNVSLMNSMFEDCQKLRTLPDISFWDTQNVMEISYMFKNCEALTSFPDITKWNINKITNISGLFQECKSITSLPDLSKWDMKNVENISSLFESCSSLISIPDISKWNLINATDINSMFSYCENLSSLPDISK